MDLEETLEAPFFCKGPLTSALQSPFKGSCTLLEVQTCVIDQCFVIGEGKDVFLYQPLRKFSIWFHEEKSSLHSLPVCLEDFTRLVDVSDLLVDVDYLISIN